MHLIITEIPYDASKSLAKAFEDGSLEEENFPQWTKATSKIWSRVLDGDEEHHVDEHRLSQTRGQRNGEGAVTSTSACEHCNLFPVEDFLWRVTVRS